MAIDFGQKRTGLAVTDELQMIATALATVPTAKLLAFIADYVAEHAVERFVVGLPLTLQNKPSQSAAFVEPFVKKLKKLYPAVPVERVDERFTSKMATDSILLSGLPKNKRQDKSLIDQVSAVIILQSYMAQRDSLAMPPSRPLNF